MARKKIKAAEASDKDYSVVNVIICDDIRREDNGKEILIGVYVENMLIDAVPALLPAFCVRIVTKWETPGDHKIDGLITGPDGKEIMKYGGSFTLPTGQKLVSIPFRVSPFLIPAFGRYEIKVGTQESSITIETFEVVKRGPIGSGDTAAMK